MKDFDELLQQSIDYEQLRNKSVLVTGATGMIASYLIYFLDYLNLKKSLNITIILLVRNEKKARKVFNKVKSPYKIIVNDLTEKIKIEDEINIIIHAASLADSQYYESNPVDVLIPNTVGTYFCLELGVEKKIDNFLFFSSAEIYGNIQKENEISEEVLGIIDPMNIRSCYSESKKMGENMCYSYFKQYNIPSKIVRIFHTYGPTMDIKNDKRVFSEFAKEILENNKITLKSDGSAKKVFCYVSDVISGLFYVLLKGKSGEVYNLANDDCFMSILEFAQRISSSLAEREICVDYIKRNEGDKYLENTVTTYKNVSTSKIRLLGWKPSITVEDGFRRVIEYKNPHQEI